MIESQALREQAINTIRFLSADGVQAANSGHPGLPMGAAAMAYTIWTRHLRHNPKNPGWINRDRFVLSGGHGSMLLYSLLHLTGYDLSLQELKNFRQWGSKTPGHPEYGHTPGVETTTGPLGQGFSNGVGMAIASKFLASRFNRDDFNLINHNIFAIVTDGDLMEGVASEAASLAGHLHLGNLIYLYDDNQITIDGTTDIAFTENRADRFSAYGWHVQTVLDGNDVDEIDAAIRQAKLESRPSLISVRTQIGYGLPNRAGTPQAHGEPPGAEELRGAKENLGWPLEPDFFIPDEVLSFYRLAVEKGAEAEEAWQTELNSYSEKFPGRAKEFDRILKGELPENWDAGIPTFSENPKGMATRVASGKVLNAIAPNLPDLIGGSADLTPSTKTWIDGSPSFQPPEYAGRNINFGVREHGMGAMVNGMAFYPGIIPYGATFLVFSDYMRGALRISSLSGLLSIWVFTHDSIGLGEDGPTHQPVEHALALRAMPNMTVIRPCDANEVAEAWRAAILNQDGPTALLLSRQGVPTLSRETFNSAEGLHRGAYILADFGEGTPDLILMATGSEVSLMVEAGENLRSLGKKVRLVSFPSWELFSKQDQEYQDSVFPPSVTARISVEAGVTLGWERWVGTLGRTIGVDQYGTSAPYQTIYENYGLTVENIVMQSLELIGKE
jgi:transketolase